MDADVAFTVWVILSQFRYLSRLFSLLLSLSMSILVSLLGPRFGNSVHT